ncbi:hypothetical protein HPB52_003333 [Rhipicephalus sanguineus]|uniref:Uncharacterized protein n=1 Tax=Rhipicephalus sanguineus TaxID=34632 RepID=A0A9D4QG40_RHISA|nr:hypothetical protein HPB52_003333 [Rhipicephalus sanguineus]
MPEQHSTGPNERLLRRNWRAVTRFNREAREFDSRLLNLCHYDVDHAIDRFPPCAVLAADGLHPSFAGVSLLAWNFYNLLLDLRRPYIYITDWQDHAPQPEAHFSVTILVTLVEAARGTTRTKWPLKQPPLAPQASRSGRDHLHGVRDRLRVYIYLACRRQPGDIPRKRRQK